MQSIVDDLNAHLSNSSHLPDCTIDYKAVKTAVARLKPACKKEFKDNIGLYRFYV